MTRTTRRRSAAAAAVLALLLLAGCGDGPVKSGAAAVVGDERIETSELEAIVERGLASPEAQQQFGSDRADYQRQVLGRLVRAQLLEQAARDAGVEVTPGEVDAQLAEFADQVGGREELEAQASAGGIAPQDLPRFAREVALELQLGDELTSDIEVDDAQLAALYEQGRGQFQQARSRHILVADEAQARDVLAQVQADPDAFADLAAKLSTDTSNKDQGGELGWQGRGSFVPAFDDAVFTEPIGEPFVVQTEFGWHVVEVEERKSKTLAQATPELRRAALDAERKAAVQEALQKAAEELGVEVSPRFGRWDAQGAAITADDADRNSSPEPSPSTGGQPAPGEQPGGQQPGGQPAPSPAS